MSCVPDSKLTASDVLQSVYARTRHWRRDFRTRSVSAEREKAYITGLGALIREELARSSRGAYDVPAATPERSLASSDTMLHGSHPSSIYSPTALESVRQSAPILPSGVMKVTRARIGAARYGPRLSSSSWRGRWRGRRCRAARRSLAVWRHSPLGGSIDRKVYPTSFLMRSTFARRCAKTGPSGKATR
jgi:hypothetical protein